MKCRKFNFVQNVAGAQRRQRSGQGFHRSTAVWRAFDRVAQGFEPGGGDIAPVDLDAGAVGVGDATGGRMPCLTN